MPLQSPKAVLDVGRLLADQGKPVSLTFGVVLRQIRLGVWGVDMGDGNEVRLPSLQPVGVGNFVWIAVQAERAVIIGAENQGWIDHAPVIQQSGTVAYTQTYSRFLIEGSKCTYIFELQITGAGTTNNTVAISLPRNVASGVYVRKGGGYIYDANTGTRYNGTWISGFVSNHISLVGDWSGGGAWGTAPNLALASGDFCSGAVEYQLE